MLTLTNSSSRAIALPQPLPPSRVNIIIRPGTMDDVPFLDSLQKLHTKQVGWMPTAQFEGKIKLGHVIIAADSSTGSGLGYCIGNDQYFKRDDVGIIYQLNVMPTKQRGLIGATLVKAMFNRAAYGCKLFCCWCAQDIQANYFWESVGFVPLAFRAGSRGKGRVHIFWQRRIRAGDTTTPYWFPSQTTSGSIREDRLVLPIPPGTHWSDAKPLVLPGAGNPQLENRAPKVRAPKTKAPVIEPSAIISGGLRFAAQIETAIEPKPKREPKQKVKNDPRLVAAARELRDRWLEKVNSGQYLPAASEKYDVSRIETTASGMTQIPLLEAA